LAYGKSSTFFGSIITSFTCEGCFLYSKDMMMELIPTDLPCPVAPATSKCGILARSATSTSFLIVLPNDFVQRNRRPDGGPDFRDLDFVIQQSLDDLVLIGFQFGAVHFGLARFTIQEEFDVRRGVVGQVQRWVVGFRVVFILFGYRQAGVDAFVPVGNGQVGSIFVWALTQVRGPVL